MALFLVFAVILFVAAGTLHWKTGWVYLIHTLGLSPQDRRWS
jgi:ABC-type uncharacterized transport system permease subunit